MSLVVTEFVANAIRHGQQPGELGAHLIDGHLRIEVTDAEPSPPAIDRAPTEAGGYGLRIVDSIADRRGWEPLPSGKVVWAEVPKP